MFMVHTYHNDIFYNIAMSQSNGYEQTFKLWDSGVVVLKLGEMANFNETTYECTCGAEPGEPKLNLFLYLTQCLFFVLKSN